MAGLNSPGGKEPTLTLPSASRTTSGVAAIGQIGHSRKITVFADVTAVTGTNPVISIRLETSPDNVLFFPKSDVLVTNVVDKATVTFENLGKYAQIAYTITGSTPDFTFEVNTNKEN